MRLRLVPIRYGITVPVGARQRSHGCFEILSAAQLGLFLGLSALQPPLMVITNPPTIPSSGWFTTFQQQTFANYVQLFWTFMLFQSVRESVDIVEAAAEV